ncbi:LytR/AlgR family response regulator transcription factor [Thalassotalea hakodatensis]|uniref:LytR/AlgR family response regulator transcription factor n=1 Tax=Thalassotalea hakodatensis TaxID=3030492 RepID=UPI0025746434|nr:LytTR family DNA-binding domain-containing protein [Thalassotalea hakodatensis]
MTIRYMIIDDEPIAHRIIQDYCTDMPHFSLTNNSYNALQALEYLKNHDVELIFLDINMPKLKGFDFLRTLKHPPQVIVTSAYQEYALEGYDLNVVDYLLKPFSLARFIQAINKVSEQESITNTGSTTHTTQTIFVKGDKQHYQVQLADIEYIKAYGNYSILYLTGHRIIIQQTMVKFEKQLPSEQFIRIHKSFIVAKNKVKSIQSNKIQIGSASLPIGQTYKKTLNEWTK